MGREREREKQIVKDIFWKLEESKKEDTFQSLGNFRNGFFHFSLNF